MNRSVFDLLAAIVDYPDENLAVAVDEAAALAGVAAVTGPLESFGEVLSELSLDDLREHYVAMFDFAPACTLQLGFHLYGDSHARGALLVRLLDAMRRADVHPGRQLPDHLSCVLTLIARGDLDRAAEFATIVAPALDRIRHALAERHSPYADLIGAARAAITEVRPAGALQR
jgi:nitrate reductase molybdenum cofactor assembly chaperone